VYDFTLAAGLAVGADCTPSSPGWGAALRRCWTFAAPGKREELKVKTVVELIEKLFDKYFLGSGTSSIRPENEVADLIRKGAYILDVRFAFEAKKGLAPGATNISLLQLKRHLGELPRDRTIVTYCQTGGRAGKARDILDRNGFKVINGGAYESVRNIVMKSRSTAA
jgi:rhodanese-related sulfurtransferase